MTDLKATLVDGEMRDLCKEVIRGQVKSITREDFVLMASEHVIANAEGKMDHLVEVMESKMKGYLGVGPSVLQEAVDELLRKRLGEISDRMLDSFMSKPANIEKLAERLSYRVDKKIDSYIQKAVEARVSQIPMTVTLGKISKEA